LIAGRKNWRLTGKYFLIALWCQYESYYTSDLDFQSKGLAVARKYRSIRSWKKANKFNATKPQSYLGWADAAGERSTISFKSG
jgi:hypothetical protein